ncbi:MAG TPA: universal stress protein [Terriglobia bacterium]|nr:universal stress protein [Terriglobia bacterium]
MTIQRILVPVDMTEKSLAAVDFAFDLATRFSAETILLHVIEKIEYVTFDEMKDLYQRLESSAASGLQEFSERFQENGLTVDCLVTFGHRTQGIVDCAVERRADLIIMASHRIDPDRPGHDWSTISYGVAILAPCAVLLMK